MTSKHRLSNRLNNFPEYVFSVLASKVKQQEAETGRKVLNFGPGSPDIMPSKEYINKFKEFIEKRNAHRYPGYGPIPEFTVALKNWYFRRFGVSLKNNEVYVVSGAKDAISHLPLALMNAGDEALVPDPGYQGYVGPILMVNGKHVSYSVMRATHKSLDSGMNPAVKRKILVDEVAEKITSKTRFIWVNFPSNPTGATVERGDLISLVQLCKKHGLWLIYDNAYSEITFNEYVAPSILEIEGSKEIALEIGSFSKMLSLAGYRIGYAVGNSRIIKALSKVKSQMDSGVSTPIQKMAAFALNNYDKSWYKRMIDEYDHRRAVIAKYLKKLGMEFELPKAGLYIWARIPEQYQDSEEFVFDMLKSKNVLFTPGIAFGENGKKYVRVSICIDISMIDEYLGFN